jgi:hypothetical protein
MPLKVITASFVVHPFVKSKIIPHDQSEIEFNFHPLDEL